MEQSDLLEINPLIPASCNYFIAQNVLYHGHNLTVLYDKDGSRYKACKGISVFIDGKLNVRKDQLTGSTEKIANQNFVKTTDVRCQCSQLSGIHLGKESVKLTWRREKDCQCRCESLNHIEGE